MNALAKHEEQSVAVADGASVLAIISRAANDPNTDIEKLERLMALYERISARGAEQAFNEAMNSAQAELGPVAADADNPQTKSKYASYAALDRAVRPIYARHGFSLSFGTADSPAAEHVRVTCRVAHRDGYCQDYHLDMPADGKGAKGGDVMTKTHAAGAAMSYGQRYLLKLIFNIAVGDDMDGNLARGPREQSAGATAAFAALNAATTASDLAVWKRNNAEAVRELPEAAEIIALYNRRVEAVRSAAQ